MEVLIDHLGEFPPESADLNEVIDACPQYSLKTAELFQQLAPLDRSQTRYGFQYRLVVTFGAFSAMPCDRKSMRFVAHALNQVQCTRLWGQYSGRVLTKQEQLLLSCASI